MEAEGAARLYGRSIEKHKFRYIPFVGDGDSKSYSSVCKSLPYGAGVTIPKEDCIGHVTKRMGTALRKVKADYGGMSIGNPWESMGLLIIIIIRRIMLLLLLLFLLTPTMSMNENLIRTLIIMHYIKTGKFQSSSYNLRSAILGFVKIYWEIT